MILRNPLTRGTLSLLLLLVPTLSRAEAPPSPPAGVVLELFTSQGCSTCPPADALASKLAQDPEWQGKLVVLGFHVDYWNYVGWTDPFSSADWTDRQRGYAKRIARGDVYTPQAVINGHAAAVGSDERAIRGLLAAAASQPAGRVELRLRRDGSKVTADLVAAPPAGRTGRLDLALVVLESGLETAVGSGENAHRTLHDDFVVRRLQRVAKLNGAEEHASASIRLERGWNAENVRFAAFLQDPDTREIVGAAQALLPR